MPPPSRTSRLLVVGLGADGWDGLAEPVRARLRSAPAALGGPRQLALLPDDVAPVRRAWPRPFHLDAALALAAEHPGAVVLASGDPTLSGVGTLLAQRLGADAVEILPAVSSPSLARARLGWGAESSHVVTVVGRRIEPVLRELAPGRRLLVLSSDATTPDLLAPLLVAAGYGATRMTALGDLGAAHESRVEATAEAWVGGASALHVLALECVGPPALGWAAGLPDDAFEHDGQLTKRDLRASALARLAPAPGLLLWDVGAGAGSIGVEWLRAHPGTSAVAVERDPERAARIARNAARLGVPRLEVVTGSAPDALADLAPPDAVFVGGGATVPGVLEACLDALRPGGVVVVHGVTIETERLLADAHRAHGGELTRHAVETAAPVGGFTGWTPARTVTQWAWRSPAPQHPQEPA